MMKQTTRNFTPKDKKYCTSDQDIGVLYLKGMFTHAQLICPANNMRKGSTGSVTGAGENSTPLSRASSFVSPLQPPFSRKGSNASTASNFTHSTINNDPPKQRHFLGRQISIGHLLQQHELKKIEENGGNPQLYQQQQAQQDQTPTVDPLGAELIDDTTCLLGLY